MHQVRKDILKLLYAKNMGHILEPDVLPDGRPYYGALLVNLAYQVSGTSSGGDEASREATPLVAGPFGSLPILQHEGCCWSGNNACMVMVALIRV